MSQQTPPNNREELGWLNDAFSILSQVSSVLHMKRFSGVFLDLVSKASLRNINPMVLSAMANNFCAKVFLSNPEIPIDEQTFSVLDFLFAHDLVPPVFAAAMKQRQQQLRQVNFGISFPQQTVTPPRLTGSLPPTQPNSSQPGPSQPSLLALSPSPADNVQKILAQLLSLNTGEKINKNYGYSLLALNGDFIWCDSVSLKLFEFKEKKNINKNLFEQMIPFSKQLLAQKYGPQLFRDHCDFGSSLVFSYVTYSKNSMNKFYKCIKALAKTDQNFEDRLRRIQTDEAIYNQYLKALSSRATLVLLKFTQGELQAMINDKGLGLKLKSQFFADLKVKKPEKRRKPLITDTAVLLDAISDPRGSQERRKFRAADPSKKKTENSEEVILREAVLLETRLSYHTPKFEYGLLRDDPRIQQFEAKILKRLRANL